MQTVAWMVGREGGVTELLFDAPEGEYVIAKELVFRDDAEQVAQYARDNLARKLGLMAEVERKDFQLANRAAEVASLQDHVSRRIKQHNDLAEAHVALQAKLDAVMLEHCPDEMTPEQKANWARHQVPAWGGRPIGMGPDGGEVDYTP